MSGIIMVLSEVYCRWMKFGLSKCRIRTYFMRLTVVLFIICVNTRLLPKVDLQAIRKLQPVLYYGMQMKQNVHVIQDLRQLRINKICPRLQKEIPAELAFKPSYEEMYVDETRRYIYCLVSKASCTSWKRTLFKMADNSTVNNFTNGNSELWFKLVHDRAFSDKILRRLSNYTSEEIQYRLNNYYKFMFVREPLERLVSAYRDKMLRDDEYVPMFAPVIIKKYRHSNQTDSNVTFSEFVRYVIDSWHEGGELDRHWRPQFRLCQPCQIHYDFIGHYETLYEDADAVLERLNSGVNPKDIVVSQFPRVDPDNQQYARSSEKMTEFYSSISEDTISELYHLYAPDYELFGYSHPNVNGKRA